jgi:hypothetical protein
MMTLKQSCFTDGRCLFSLVRDDLRVFYEYFIGDSQLILIWDALVEI